MDLLIEGYAAIFGEPDRCGDIVRAGAFASSLTRSISRPMLLAAWTRVNLPAAGSASLKINVGSMCGG